MLEPLAISYCEKGRLLPYVLVSEVVQEVGPSIQALGVGGVEYPFSGDILDQTSGI